jgi:hypothetical protein
MWRDTRITLRAQLASLEGTVSTASRAILALGGRVQVGGRL